MGAQKNHLIEMVLLSTNNICFGQETKTKKLVTPSESAEILMAGLNLRCMDNMELYILFTESISMCCQASGLDGFYEGWQKAQVNLQIDCFNPYSVNHVCSRQCRVN